MEINELVLEIRSKLNLTQQELAEKLNISRGTIWRVEYEYSYPNLMTIKKIVDFAKKELGYNIEFKEFFKRNKNNAL
jgi:transcriptional regulator with XRE-family HTH domain